MTRFSRLSARKKRLHSNHQNQGGRYVKSNASLRQVDQAKTRAFSRTDLVAVIGVMVLLSLLLLPALARESEDAERAVCLKNMQQIIAAVAMYSTDNNDFLPHPSWGSDLTGPDNWCYATRLQTGQRAQSAAGISGPEAHTIQLPFYLAGQLAPFLESQRVLVCPTDWRESMNAKRALYIQRAVKLTSYQMSGTVGGYVGNSGLIPNGRTYKTTDFLPTDMLFWEANESNPFNFNDAAENPETVFSLVSRRHTLANGQGMSVVGRSGGTADFVKWGTFLNLLSAPRPNELLCGPGYQ
jgi:hypothetical protein